MKSFFGNELFLSSDSAMTIYSEVKELPIIDYHCHLDAAAIAGDAGFEDIGELWLSADHYKWRAMRLCGVDEKYITGNASYKEKFFKYAEIMPRLAGNPLYYWTHMELVSIFGIRKPLSAETAEEIYEKATAILRGLSVSELLRRFRVEYIATTDDPVDALSLHGRYGSTDVAPTFRPDKVYSLDDDYIDRLGKAADTKIETLDDLLAALVNRLDYFVSKGCRISDHGFEKFPRSYATKDEADRLFAKRKDLTAAEKDSLFGFLLLFLTREYGKRGMLMQIHFSVIRNNNPDMFKRCGPDSGFDLIAESQNVNDLVRFLAMTPDEERPETVLYTLNDSSLASIACATGAFRNVKMGAAWWFNDTVEGIRKNLKVISEYAAIGTSYGMLTDSRSFASYVRFDFFRRLLSDHLGALVDAGEYDLSAAISVAKDVCYNNIKNKIR